MINPRLSCCKECADALALVKEIDCKLYELSLDAYNNIIFALNLKINQQAVSDLLNYKRILLFKSQNDNYAQNYSVNMIASKIKKYIIGCRMNCLCKQPIKELSTTTTTTTIFMFGFALSRGHSYVDTGCSVTDYFSGFKSICDPDNLVIGCVIYNSNNINDPLYGGNLWYKLPDIPNVIKIDKNGVIKDIQPCT
jgi:hypothetical protein